MKDKKYLVNGFRVSKESFYKMVKVSFNDSQIKELENNRKIIVKDTLFQIKE